MWQDVTKKRGGVKYRKSHYTVFEWYLLAKYAVIHATVARWRVKHNVDWGKPRIKVDRDRRRWRAGNWQAAVNDRHHSLASLGGRRHIVTPALPRPLAQSDLQQTAR